MLKRIPVRVAAALVVLHAVILGSLGPRSFGPLFSDVAQVLMGVAVLWACTAAVRNSSSYGRYLWRVTGIAFAIWVVGQTVAVGIDLTPLITGHAASSTTQWYSSVLFSLWFLPLGLTLFVDPDEEFQHFDWIVVLDSLQAAVVLLASFLFFFYIPSRAGQNGDLASSVRNPYFLVHAALLGAFLLRAVFDRHASAKSYFRWMTLFLGCSMLADSVYFYSSAHALPTGSWFDLVWSAVLVIPVIASSSWVHAPERSGLGAEGAPAYRTVSTQFFPLMYPLLVLTLASNLTDKLKTAALAVVLFSYGCSSTRLLITHHRLVKFQVSLQHRASHDGLTGVWNRLAILEILQRELVRSQRTGTQVGAVMVDADWFKLLNDTHGHITGDMVLQQLAQELTSTVRPYDSVGRIGGEEFLIVLPNCSLKECTELAERIRLQVENSSVTANHKQVRFSISLGVSSGSGEDAMPKLLQAADTALYRAKAKGRNRTEIEPIATADYV